jgi:hypothetical protein
MALPRALRPAVIIRRKALYTGLLGPSRFWKVIAVWVFGKATLKKFFGRNVEVLDAGPLGVGRYLSVETSEPLTPRRRRQLAKAGKPVPTRAAVKAAAEAEAKTALKARSKR